MKQRLLLILSILSIRVLSCPKHQVQVINDLNASNTLAVWQSVMSRMKKGGYGE